MTVRELNNRFTAALRGALAGELKVMTGLAVLLLAAHAAYTAYLVGFTSGLASATETYIISGGGGFVMPARLAVTAGLLVCAAGLALRRSSGVLASALGLVWVALVYVWWRRESLALLRSAEAADLAALQPQDSPLAGVLWGASWLDLLVLAGVAALLVWQGLALARVVKSHGVRLGSSGLK